MVEHLLLDWVEDLIGDSALREFLAIIRIALFWMILIRIWEYKKDYGSDRLGRSFKVWSTVRNSSRVSSKNRKWTSGILLSS